MDDLIIKCLAKQRPRTKLILPKRRSFAKHCKLSEKKFSGKTSKRLKLIEGERRESEFSSHLEF
jgi:hypothetical protein